MNENEILDIISRIEIEKSIDQNTCIAFLHEYVFERKGKQLTGNTFRVLADMFTIEGMLTSAVDYYKNKLNLISLYKDGAIIKVYKN